MNEQMVVDYFVQQLPGLRALYLYGSMALGQAGLASDVDIAVVADQPIPSVRIFELAEDLASRLNLDVDLIDLRAVSTVMCMQVISRGRRLFGAGLDVELFEDRVYAQYARLNEERSALLADISERGSIYG